MTLFVENSVAYVNYISEKIKLTHETHILKLKPTVLDSKIYFPVTQSKKKNLILHNKWLKQITNKIYNCTNRLTVPLLLKKINQC